METSNGTYYEDLITRYLMGEANPDEIAEITRWVESDPANQKVFVGLHATWLKLQEDKVAAIDVGSDFQNVMPAASSHTPWFSTGAFLRIAALFLIILVPSFFMIKYFSSGKKMQLVADNSPVEQQLPDGTIVTLNAASILEYPGKFKGRSRAVALEGDALFEVAQNQEQPFVISSGKVRIEVLGTTFYVDTRYGENLMQVVLSTGSVALYFEDDPTERLTLHAGQTASISVSGEQITVAPSDDPNFLSWKTRRISFTDEPLGKVVHTLNKVYLKEIIITDPSLANCRITATFDHQPFESVIHVLEAVLGIKTKTEGSTILISGPACK